MGRVGGYGEHLESLSRRRLLQRGALFLPSFQYRMIPQFGKGFQRLDHLSAFDPSAVFLFKSLKRPFVKVQGFFSVFTPYQLSGGARQHPVASGKTHDLFLYPQFLQEPPRVGVCRKDGGKDGGPAWREGAPGPPDMEIVQRGKGRTCSPFPLGLRSHLVAWEPTFNEPSVFRKVHGGFPFSSGAAFPASFPLPGPSAGLRGLSEAPTGPIAPHPFRSPQFGSASRQPLPW
ncbi:hypothetical protein SDC9_115420 [bioreactor metagenome]|uniref:Uncharacterized protein n=1 Tax=bioreactor metagenome TaxID=1076179 RepID=A0A645BTE9_9ZZZZ